jgi:hypothetical protein
MVDKSLIVLRVARIRRTASGIALRICAIAGIALFKEHYVPCMAIAGGSTLLVTGFWLRQA